SNNMLFSASFTGQSFIWWLIALLFRQIFADAGSAKAVKSGVFFFLYILRSAIDISNIKFSSFILLSLIFLSYLYVNYIFFIFFFVFTVILVFIVLACAYMFEVKRDVAAGYMSEARVKVHASKTLQSLTGLVLRQQRTAAIAWIIGLFVLGITYGSMISKIGSL